MKWYLTFLISLILFTSVLAVDPPVLTNFHQFYGKINGLPAGNIYELRVQVADVTFSENIVDGRYGYSPTFKVSGENGQEIKFFAYNVATRGLTQLIPTYNYRGGEVKNLDLNYPGYTPAGSGSSGSGSSGSGSSGSGSSGSGSSGSGSSGSGSSGSGSSGSGSSSSSTVPGTCLQSWDCREWTDCQSGRQSRECFRGDSCDAQLAAGTVSAVESSVEPSKSRACTSNDQVSAGSDTKICPPNSKRCSGKNLEQCSSDGQQWQTVLACPNGCNSVILNCKAESGPVVNKPSIPWIPIILATVILIAVIITVVAVIQNKKKYAPLKNYIDKARAKGMGSMQIKSKLISQGWDADKIEKYIK
jgi:hypothetical protein